MKIYKSAVINQYCTLTVITAVQTEYIRRLQNIAYSGVLMTW